MTARSSRSAPRQGRDSVSALREADRRVDGAPPRVRLGGVDRQVSPLPAEPRPLAASEGEIAVHVDGKVAAPVQATVQEVPRLAVADGGEGGPARVEAGSKGLRLGEDAAVELRLGASGDPRPMAIAIGDVEPESQDGPGVSARRGQGGIAGKGGDLERPDDTPRVAQVGAAGEPGRT